MPKKELVRQRLKASTSDPAMVPIFEETWKLSACGFIMTWNLGFWKKTQHLQQ